MLVALILQFLFISRILKELSMLSDLFTCKRKLINPLNIQFKDTKIPTIIEFIPAPYS